MKGERALKIVLVLVGLLSCGLIPAPSLQPHRPRRTRIGSTKRVRSHGA